ncbi:hypothetical protein ACF0H5_018384 [Mactra antiquata]
MNLKAIYILPLFFVLPSIRGDAYISNSGIVHISKEDQLRAVQREYEKCSNNVLTRPYPSGVYCNRTWDNIACWPDTLPGVVQFQLCPTYIEGFYTLGNATRRCMSDGTWYISHKTNKSWTNYSQCTSSPRSSFTEESKLVTVHIEYIQLMYNTGYGVSFLSLLLAVFTMLKFEKLHCPRNTVHINLFVSFILRAMISFLKDLLFVQGLGFSFDVKRTSKDAVLFIETGTHWECKLLSTLFHYILLANYMWILVEGLYLHTLVYVSVFSERGRVRWYYLLGWGKFALQYGCKMEVKH